MSKSHDMFLSINVNTDFIYVKFEVSFMSK